MRPSLFISTLVAVCALLAPSPSSAQDDDLKKLLDQLKSGRVVDQKTAIQTIRVRRGRVIFALIRLVKDHADDRGHAYEILFTKQVMELLGKIRAVEAVPVLAEHLTYSGRPPGPGVSSPPSLEGNWPAVAALIRIGVRSLGPVVERVASSDEVFVDRCGALVVDGVLGPRLAPVYLKDCIDKEKDPKRRERLELLLLRTEQVGRNPKHEIIK